MMARIDRNLITLECGHDGASGQVDPRVAGHSRSFSQGTCACVGRMWMSFSDRDRAAARTAGAVPLNYPNCTSGAARNAVGRLRHCIALAILICCSPIVLALESEGNSSMLYDVCSGDADFGMWGRARVSQKTIDDAIHTGGWRIKIIGGKLYINTVKFLPVQRLPGKRDFHSFLGLLRLTQKYGAKLPNVEFVMQHNDMPKVNVAGRNPPTFVKKVLKKGKVRDTAAKNPPLVFSTYTSVGQKRAWDIPWPQFTFWGENLDSRASDPPWRVLRKTMMDAWLPFSERNASLFYSGAPYTNPLRAVASKCPYGNFLVNRPGLKVYGEHKCRFKYLLYVDGTYASGSILPIVGCGSVPFLVKSPWTTAWSRCLVPYKHYIPVVNNPKTLCADLKSKVEWADQHPEEAEEIARNVQEFVRNKLSMESIYDYMMRRLSRYSKLLTFQPKVSKKEDLLIADFEGLVRAMDFAMKRVGTVRPEMKRDRFVAFHKGDRCCTKCPELPHFQHLCPGEDLGWLEDDERSVLRGCSAGDAACEDGAPEHANGMTASGVTAVDGPPLAAMDGGAVTLGMSRPHPHPHPHPHDSTVLQPYGAADADLLPRMKPRKKGKRG